MVLFKSKFHFQILAGGVAVANTEIHYAAESVANRDSSRHPQPGEPAPATRWQTAVRRGPLPALETSVHGSTDPYYTGNPRLGYPRVHLQAGVASLPAHERVAAGAGARTLQGPGAQLMSDASGDEGRGAGKRVVDAGV